MDTKTTKRRAAVTAPRGFAPDYAVPPGETLKETLDALGLTQRDLAERTELTPKTVNLIINGKAPISVATALRFERVTGVPARLWNELEHRFQERCARLAEHQKLAKDLEWLKGIPTRELARRGVIAPHRDRAAMLAEVLRFFGVASVDAWHQVWDTPTVAFRKSARVKSSPGAVAAWVRLAEHEALQVPCNAYNEKRFRYSLNEIRKLTLAEGAVLHRRMVDTCSAAGVALVLVPGLKGAPVSGAARWLTPEKAMISLSLRYKTDDHFWFSLFHEAAHILNDSKKELFVDWRDSKENQREREANQFAATLLIPPDREKELQDLKTVTAIQRFADSIDIAPGVVVGRLQREGLVPFNLFNRLKRNVQLGHRGGT